MKVRTSPVRSLVGVTICSAMPSTQHADKSIVCRKKGFFPPKVLSPPKKTPPKQF